MRSLFFIFASIIFQQSSASAQIAGKYFDTEYVHSATEIAQACGSGSDTIVEFSQKSVDFIENSCRINRIASWPQSNTMFDYFVSCSGGNRKTRLIIEKTSADKIWIQWDDGSKRSKTSGSIYQKCPSALPATQAAQNLPQKLGECVSTTISKITDRLGKPLGTKESFGTTVTFANGGYQVSYSQESSIARSTVGDPVKICLKELPKNCPPGDDRVKIYNTKNLRTDEAWSLSDALHVCGGA